MRVTPSGASEYHEGNEVGRYGRDLGAHERVFVWYHSGLRKYDEPAWAMDTDVAFKISISVDTFLVASQDGLYAVARDAFEDSVETIDGRDQYVARASDGFVTRVGEPSEHLQGSLWVESGNEVDEGYHQRRNE